MKRSKHLIKKSKTAKNLQERDGKKSLSLKKAQKCCHISLRMDVKRAFNLNVEKLRKNHKKYVCQHEPVAILATHQVKKV